MKLRNKLIATIVSISMVLAVIGVGAWASTESFTATITNTVNLEFDNLKGAIIVMAGGGADNLQTYPPAIEEQVLYDGTNVVYDQISANPTNGTNLYWAGTTFMDSSDNGLGIVNNETGAAVLVYGFIYNPTEDCTGMSTITAMVTQTSLPEISGGQLIVKYFASTNMQYWTEIQSGVPITPVSDNEQLIIMAVCQYYNTYGASITTSASAWDFNVAFSAGRSEKAPLTGIASMDIWNFSTGVILPYDHGNDGSTLQSIEFRSFASNATSVTFDYYNDEYNSIIDGVTPTAADVYGTGSINLYVVGTDLYFLSDGKIYAPADCSYKFSGLTSLTSIQFKNIDTSKVTDMSYMFSACQALATLDLSSFDTSKVTDMSYMFYSCSALATLDLSSFDTSKVTDMSYMFYSCSALTTLDLSSFDTSKVTDMYEMFYACDDLTTLDLSSFDTSKVTSMNAMFCNCYALTTLDVSSFDTSKVTDMSFMFSSCYDLTTLDLSSFDTSKVTTMDCMFYHCNALTTLDLSNFDTSNVTGMSSMFIRCNALTTLDLSSFDTSNVTSMSYMFVDCNALTTLDLSNFDTSNVTGMTSMFSRCNALTTLDVSNFDTSSVTSMYQMFVDCNALTTLDVSNFDTSNVTSMYSMFSGCYALTTLDLSNFDTSKVTTMYSMFSGCSDLTTIYVSDAWSTTNVTTSSDMFSSCTSLVGGNGTKYSSSYKDATYARIDTASTPGYLTAK